MEHQKDFAELSENLTRRISRRGLLKLVGAAGLAGLAAACGATATPAPAPPANSSGGQPAAATKAPAVAAAPTQAPAAAPAKPAASGRGTLRIGYDGDIIKLDPGVSQSGVDWTPINLIFGRLVNFDNTMLNPTPDVAESWTLAPDNITYTFKIRQGVMFHTGRECTADDVEYSFKRGFELGPKGRFAGYMASVDTYKANSKYEFQIKLKQPDASFFPNLCTSSNSIYDKETIDKIDTKPIGTGPYTFVEWIPGESARYKKFDKYWDQKFLAKMPDEIITKPIPEEQTRIANLKAGQIDIAVNISPQFWKDIEGTKGLKLLRQEYTSSYYCLDFNLRKPPFDNVKLRQALLRAVDRETIHKNVFFDMGKTGCSLIPQGHWAYTDIGCPAFDLAAAKKMIDDAGIKTPISIKARVLSKPDWDVKIMEILQKDWKQVGVNLEIEAMESALWVQDVFVGKNADLTIAWYTREPDPDGLFSSVLRKDQGNNFMGYNNPKIEDLFVQSKSTTDKDKRKSGYEQIMKTAMIDEVPNIKFQTIDVVWGANDKVKDFTILPRGYPNLYQWEWLG
ncbi:MAG: ABC transporter substrate-binding protein [Chloroflexi bacterium]|nr:ABC transporter substrate-binding protein [Chloroflexota bacterium]